MSELQDAIELWDINQRPTWVQPIVDAAKKYQSILDTDIDEWIEAEAHIARNNGELSWTRVHQSQAENLLAALGITE